MITRHPHIFGRRGSREIFGLSLNANPLRTVEFQGEVHVAGRSPLRAA